MVLTQFSTPGNSRISDRKTPCLFTPSNHGNFRWKESAEYKAQLQKLTSKLSKGATSATGPTPGVDMGQVNNFLLNYYIENEMSKFYEKTAREGLVTPTKGDHKAVGLAAVGDGNNRKGSINDENSVVSSKKDKTKKVTNCEHTDRKHYAKGL